MFEIVFRHDPQHPHRTTPPDAAAEARRRLISGNRAFAHVLDTVPRGSAAVRHIVPFNPTDLGLADGKAGPAAQQPFAVVLGCSDARVPTELIFNQWCNELFVVRVAGNVLGAEVLGSIDYAVKNLGDSVKLVVVLAHSGCGAATAAVDVFLEPAAYLQFATSHALRSIVDRLVVVARGAARALHIGRGDGVDRQPGYRRALIEATVVLNGALTAFTLRQELAQRTGSARPHVVFGVYDLQSRCVGLPGVGGADGTGVDLIDAPGGQNDLRTLMQQLVGSERMGRVLAGP